MRTKKRPWLVWASGALVGILAGALLAPWILDRGATPERLRSKEEAERTSRAEPAAPTMEEGNPSLRYRTDGISVVFNPVEEETPDVDPEPPQYELRTEGTGVVH